MAALSPHEWRRLKKEARAFARRAVAGTTYYVVDYPNRIVWEIEFKKKPLVGLMWGSYSPERLYVLAGTVYEDRDHRAIRNLPTWREHNEMEEKFEAAFLAGRGHYEALDQATCGTAPATSRSRFRSTW